MDEGGDARKLGVAMGPWDVKIVVHDLGLSATRLCDVDKS